MTAKTTKTKTKTASKAKAQTPKRAKAEKPAASPGPAAAFAAAVSKSWSDPRIRKARAARYGFRVSGKDHPSMAKAMAAVALPLVNVAGHRAKAVRDGKVTISGKTFTLVQE